MSEMRGEKRKRGKSHAEGGIKAVAKRLSTKTVAALLVLCSATMLLTGCFLYPRMPVSRAIGSPMVTGNWDGDIFTNEWTGITFELPPGFSVFENSSSAPGSFAEDFMIFNKDLEVVISLTYHDVARGEKQKHSAEDYLDITREQLAGSTTKTYTFAEPYENATIAEREYVLMSGELFNNDDPTKVLNMDGYAHRFVGTMMVFIAVYRDDSKGVVTDFLGSLERTW